MSNTPLAGIRVLDFTWMIAGTMATRPLANLGAQVIKVESRARVDGMRMGNIRVGDQTNPDASVVFNDCNTSKLGMAIDLGRPEGIALVKRLVAISDIVVNNFSGTRMERWGLGYEALRTIKPEIVMAQMPVMGTTGPLRDYRGNGPHILAMLGFNDTTGFPGRPPTGTDVAYPDFSANPNHAAFAMLAALHHRQRTGRGQHIDLSQIESTAALLGAPLLEYTATGNLIGRDGNADRNYAPHGVYPCAGDDHWIAIAVTTDAMWGRLCDLLGNPDWTEDERFDTTEGRLAASEELDAALATWTRDQDRYELMERLQTEHIAAGVAQDVSDLVERDEHWRERQFINFEHPELGTTATHGEPIRIDGQRAEPTRSPLLGEHTDYVLREVLHLPDDEVDALYLEGALQ